MLKCNISHFLKKVKIIIASLAASAICSFVFIEIPQVPFLKPWLGLIVDSTPEWYMNAYYNIVNSTAKRPECPNILILDLNEKMTRQDIGELLTFVSKCNPKVVGVDCTFAYSDTYDSLQTSALIESIGNLPESFPIVFAYVKEEPSAISDSLISHKGIVNFSGFYEFNPYIENVPHLSVEMARLAGYDVKNINSNSFVINYRKKLFASAPIYRGFWEDSLYLKDRIKDQMVLIGGLNNRHDVRYVPFLIESYDPSMAGTQIVAYMLSSVITASSSEYYDNRRFFHHYSRCPLWLNVVLIILLMIGYLLAYIFIDKKQNIQPWYALIKPIWLFIMMILLLALSMGITAFFYQVPDIVFFMVMTIFMGPSYDVFKQVIKD